MPTEHVIEARGDEVRFDIYIYNISMAQTGDNGLALAGCKRNLGWITVFV